ncbi:hypothetical protein EOPP23_20420 [Endozoicomonas sp. OPT23]|uniref:hypothetical protein n=1 Tax=Endozoicomonas sp. OPT23 TaxID=2072845 RepID=UPI00129AD25E|nr:hypothetical protein [Endozoicomonas sp. OPT23]MRI35327.1 hypothetical protein [Endozoicomonas sp. OPT23]
MTSGVNPNTGSSSGAGAGGTTAVSSSTTNSQVSQGYSGSNSVSSTPGTSNAGSSVTPAAPGTSNATSSDLLLRAFEAKLDGFRASVHEFNRRFNVDDLYVNDTQSLLLMIKGMISDTQALAGAVSVDQNFGTRSTQQIQRLISANDALPLRGQIVTRTESIVTESATRDGKTANLSDKQTERTTAQQDRDDAQAAGDTDEVTRLTLRIQLLDHEIANLTSEVTTLNQQIATMEAENAADQAALKSLNRILTSVTEDFVNVQGLLQRIKQRFDPAAMETGEDLRDAVAELNQQSQIEAEKNAKKRVKAKEQGERIGRDQLSNAQQVADNLQEDALSVTDFLSESDQETLRAVFGQDEALLAQIIEELNNPEVSAPDSGAADGIAIALRATVQDEEALERVVNPAAEKQYGDNLSLEGASNPQIYARLWLEAKMNEGAETQSRKEEILVEGAESEQAADDSLAEILQELQDVPLDVAGALEEQRNAAAAISQKKPI